MRACACRCVRRLTPPPPSDHLPGVTQQAAPIIIALPDEAATLRFAGDLASALRVGDVVALEGDLGAGKTTLARGIIRALAGDAFFEVPSPTFTLVQAYDSLRVPVSHFDLYRVADESELEEIGLFAAPEESLVLVEWPSRAGGLLPSPHVQLALEMAGAGRRAVLSGDAAVLARIGRALAGRALMEQAGLAAAERSYITGDASARRYERVSLASRSAILMDWPPAGQLAADDPRARFRARGASSFVAVRDALAEAGLSVPEIFAADASAGLLLMGDFGGAGLDVDGIPDAERYGAAMDMLAALHAVSRPGVLPAGNAHGGEGHILPRLAGEALQTELALFATSYAESVRGAPLGASALEELRTIWSGLDRRLQASEQGWVLFDVQSPNLFWLPGRDGIRRIGLIDFQDMFLGPTAYDVASLAQDARVTVPAALTEQLVSRYIAARAALGSPVSGGGEGAGAFREALAIAGALRHSKNLGALSHMVKSGKKNYSSHLPRIAAYMARALSHPVLSDLSLWYDTHLTPEIQVGR